MSTWWREWAGTSGLSADVRDRGELCLNEAAANVVRHGVSATVVVVAFDRTAAEVQMTVADDGDAFDPLAYPAASLPETLDEARPGGLGIQILRSSSDRMVYQRLDGRNTLTLTFAL